MTHDGLTTSKELNIIPRLTPIRPLSRLASLFVFLLLLGAGRFAYALTASAAGWTGNTYMDVVYDRQSRLPDRAVDEGSAERRWGPLFFLSMSTLRRAVPDPRALRVAERVILTALYAWTVYFLMCLFAELKLPWLEREGACRRWVLLFLCLQSTAAIYAISNGMGEIVSAFCIVAHFHHFVRRRFFAAALIICIGVYFKLYPIVFMFPYALFSIVSRDHRKYVVCLAGSVILIALAALPVSGWAFGAFYPLSMFRFLMTEPELIPLRSKEVFGPLFFVTRMLSSFSVGHADPAAAAIGRTLSSVFAMLLVASTAACALVLQSLEPRWGGEAGRRELALLVFQSVIGFLMVSFSPDVSITLLLPLIVSLYAPLWVWTAWLCPPRVDAKAAVTWLLFAGGSILCGNLVPLSMLFKVLPLTELDRLAGNTATDLLPHEKFMWYQIPMFGVCCVAAAFVCALLRLRSAGPYDGTYSWHDEKDKKAREVQPLECRSSGLENRTVTRRGSRQPVQPAPRTESDIVVGLRRRTC